MNFDINKAGFAIVEVFVLTWAAALAIWRFGRIEQKWDTRQTFTAETRDPGQNSPAADRGDRHRPVGLTTIRCVITRGRNPECGIAHGAVLKLSTAPSPTRGSCDPMRRAG